MLSNTSIRIDRELYFSVQANAVLGIGTSCANIKRTRQNLVRMVGKQMGLSNYTVLASVSLLDARRGCSSFGFFGFSHTILILIVIGRFSINVFSPHCFLLNPDSCAWLVCLARRGRIEELGSGRSPICQAAMLGRFVCPVPLTSKDRADTRA